MDALPYSLKRNSSESIYTASENDVFYSVNNRCMCCDLLSFVTFAMSFEAPVNIIIWVRSNFGFSLLQMVFCDLFTIALRLFTFSAFVLAFQRFAC